MRINIFPMIFLTFFIKFLVVSGINLKTSNTETYETLWQTVTGQKTTLVQVQACASAKVTFAEEPFDTGRNMIELEIGKQFRLSRITR